MLYLIFHWINFIYVSGFCWFSMEVLDLVLPGANGVELDKRKANAFVEQVMSSSFTSI